MPNFLAPIWTVTVATPIAAVSPPQRTHYVHFIFMLLMLSERRKCLALNLHTSFPRFAPTRVQFL